MFTFIFGVLFLALRPKISQNTGEDMSLLVREEERAARPAAARPSAWRGTASEKGCGEERRAATKRQRRREAKSAARREERRDERAALRCQRRWPAAATTHSRQPK